MNGSFLSAGLWWAEFALVMAVGCGVVVGLAAVASLLARSGRAQQALWRVCLLGVWALLVVELSGIGPALGVWVRARIAGHGLKTAPSVPTRWESRPPVAEGPPDSLPEHEAGWFVPNPGEGRDVAPAAYLGPSHRQGQGFRAGQPAVPLSPRGAAWPEISSPGDSELARRGAALPAPGSEDASGDEFEAEGRPRLPPTAGWGLSLDVVAERCGSWGARIWAIGTLVLLGWMTWNRWQLGRLRATLPAVGRTGLDQRAAGLARQLGLCRPVAVLESPRVSSPVAFGVFRPVLVVPAGFGAEFGHGQQEVMLAHEFAHLARHDPIWLLVCDLVCAVLWWHPAVWILRRQLRVASELAADESSLLVPGGPELLAGCLVGLARRRVGGRRLGWVAVEGGGFRSTLGRRVERLLGLRLGQAGPGRRSVRVPVLAGLAIGLVMVPVLSTCWVHAQAGLWQGETTMSVLRVSWQRWLAALAAAAFLGPAPAPAVAAEHPDAPKAVAPRKEGPHADRPKDAPREGEPRRVEREGRPAEPPPHVRELLERRRHLEERVRDLSAALERARPDSDDARELRGKLERARWELEEVAQQLGRRPERVEGPRPVGRPRGELPPIPPEERERRMRHLRVAVENLRAAGMHELAERVLHEAEGRPGLPGMPPGPPGPQPPKLVRAVHELAGQVQQLRREVEELRGQLRRLR